MRKIINVNLNKIANVDRKIKHLEKFLDAVVKYEGADYQTFPEEELKEVLNEGANLLYK